MEAWRETINAGQDKDDLGPAQAERRRAREGRPKGAAQPRFSWRDDSVEANHARPESRAPSDRAEQNQAAGASALDAYHQMVTAAPSNARRPEPRDKDSSATPGRAASEKVDADLRAIFGSDLVDQALEIARSGLLPAREQSIAAEARDRLDGHRLRGETQGAYRETRRLVTQTRAALGPAAAAEDPDPAEETPHLAFPSEQAQAKAVRAARFGADPSAQAAIEAKVRRSENFGHPAATPMADHRDDPPIIRVAQRDAGLTDLPQTQQGPETSPAILGEAAAEVSPPILPRRSDGRGASPLEGVGRWMRRSPVGLGLSVALSPAPAGRAPIGFGAPDGLEVIIGGDTPSGAFAPRSDGTTEQVADLIPMPDGGVYLAGAMQLGPVARLRAGPNGAGKPDLELLRPELFDDAAHPNEVNLRAKRLLLAPLILGRAFGGRRPGFGEGVDPVEFEEGYDEDPRGEQTFVTPLPEALGFGGVVTPDESDRIAAELRDAWVNGGFSALPEELRGPQIWEIRAPEGGVNEENAWEIIDQVRGRLNTTPLRRKNHYGDHNRYIPPLGDSVPEWGDRQGTGAVLQAGDQMFMGVNSGALRSTPRNLRPGRLARRRLGYPASGEARPLYHAETNVLVRAWMRSGQLPAELTLYVDRDTCVGCRRVLGRVLSIIGVQTLNIVMKSGDRLTLTREE